MRKLRVSVQFKRDLKKIKKSGMGGMEELDSVLDMLLADVPLPAQFHDHPLKGQWKPARECHVRPDVLLVYEKTAEILYLLRLSDHSELFKK